MTTKTELEKITDQKFKPVYVCEEDILNLKNCIGRLLETLDGTYDPVEILTINSIIRQFEE